MHAEKNRTGPWVYWRNNDIGRNVLHPLLDQCAELTRKPFEGWMAASGLAIEPWAPGILHWPTECDGPRFSVRYFVPSGLRRRLFLQLGMSDGELGYFHGEHAEMRGLPVPRVYACAVHRRHRAGSLLITEPLDRCGVRMDRFLQQTTERLTEDTAFQSRLTVRQSGGRAMSRTRAPGTVPAASSGRPSRRRTALRNRTMPKARERA
jgi:hypothetical protein